LYRLDTPEVAEALTHVHQANTEHTQLAAALADDQAMLEQLATDYATKTITHREWLAARAPIQTRIDATKRRLSRISNTHPIDDYVGHSAVLRDA
jgi:site-specific DNA recombinase